MTSSPMMATLAMLIANKSRIKADYRKHDDLAGLLINEMQKHGLKTLEGYGYRVRLVAAKPREYGPSPSQRKRQRLAALGQGWTYSAMDLKLDKLPESASVAA
jgi:hypothetical protein